MMPEVKRFNKGAILCFRCETKVNPYVIKEKEDGWSELECPNCKDRWEMVEVAGELRIRSCR